MSLRINPRALVAGVLLTLHLSAHAFGSATQSNPGEYAAITIGEREINAELAAQNGYRVTTSTTLLGMYLLNEKMARWEQTYNQYLAKSANTASAIVGGMSLFQQGIMTLENLRDIVNAISINPQGPFATMGMSDIYLTVANEFIQDYSDIKILTKYDARNLASGSDRAQQIWLIEDRLRKLNFNLRKLALSICCYSFEDVWNRATAGMLHKTHGDLAKEAFRRMQRATEHTTELYMGKGVI